MNRTFKKAISFILAVVLCFGMLPAAAFAETDTLTYVALGDSMSQGYMFTDYNENPEGHFCGWEGTSERSYIKKFLNDLKTDNGGNVDFIDLTIQGLQPDEVYAFLKPETFDFDSMTKGARKHIGWWTGDYETDEEQGPQYLFETFDAMSDYYIDSIKKADIITYDIGMNYFGTYLNDIRGEDEVFTKLLPDNIYTKQVESIRSEISDMLGRNGMEALGSKMDGILYAYVSYMVYTDKCISAIKELNPDAEIILVPLANPHKDLNVEINGVKISFSAIIDLMLESLNNYIEYWSPNRDQYTIAHLNGPVTSFADELYKYPDDLSKDIEVLLEKAMFGSNSVLGMDLYPIPKAFADIYVPAVEGGSPEILDWLEGIFSMKLDPFDPLEEVKVDEDGNYLMYWNVFDHLVYEYISNKYGEETAYNDLFGSYISLMCFNIFDNFAPSLAGENLVLYYYPDFHIYPENIDNARAAIAAGTAEDWQKHLIEAVDIYYGNNWLDICKKAATYRTIPLDTLMQGMSGDLSGFDADKVIALLQDPDSATDEDYIAIHLAIRYGQAARGFGAHPCERGLNVKYDAISKAYQLTQNQITYLGQKQVNLSEGVHSLYLNGKDMGEFAFAQYSDGWSIYDGEKYLAMENGKLVLKDEAFAWTYKNGAFFASASTTQKTNAYRFLFFYIPAGTKTVTTNYYLSRVNEGSLSTSKVNAELYDPDWKTVCVTATYSTKQTYSFFSLFRSKKTTSYVATVKTDTSGINVAKVEVSTDLNGKWTRSTAFTSNAPIEKFYARVTTTDGKVCVFQVRDGIGYSVTE